MPKTKIPEVCKNFLQKIITKTSLTIVGISLIAVMLTGVAAFQVSQILPNIQESKIASADTSCPLGFTLAGDVCEKRSAKTNTCLVGTISGTNCNVSLSGFTLDGSGINGCPAGKYYVNVRDASLCIPDQYGGFYSRGQEKSSSSSTPCLAVDNVYTVTVGGDSGIGTFCVPNKYPGFSASVDFGASAACPSNTNTLTFIQIITFKVCVPQSYIGSTGFVANQCNYGYVDTNDGSATPCVYYSAKALNYTVYVNPDGSETNKITAAPGSTVTQKTYYDNTTDREYTGVKLQQSIPAGFTYVNNSFRNCKVPIYGTENYCDDAGNTNDNAMFNKYITTGLSPAAAFYDGVDVGANGTSPTSTTGILDAGKKKYLNLNQCTYFQGNDYNQNVLINASPASDASNNLPSITSCQGSYLGGTLNEGFATSRSFYYNLTDKKYFNLAQCQTDLQFKLFPNWNNFNGVNNINSTNTGSSNTPITGTACTGNTNATAFQGHGAFQTLGNRYFNVSQCVYEYNPTFDNRWTNIIGGQNLATGTSTSNFASTGNCAVNALYQSALSSYKAIDLLDSTRARGYVTFQMTVPTTNAQPSYISSATMTGIDSNGNALATVARSGTLLTGVNTCPISQYFNSTSVTCDPCPAGSFCTGGATQPVICGVGTYCPAAASSATSCPANTTSPAGSTSAAACVNNVPTTLNINVNLAGNFNSTTDSMTNVLRSPTLLIPNAQPFTAAPYSYTGTETLPTTNLSANICDWVLIEVRNTSDVVITKKAALVKTNGEVIDANNAITGNTTTGISLPGVTATGLYKIIVRHRNHIPIATNTPITLTLGGTSNIDFTTNANVKGNNQIQVGTVGTGNTGSPIYGLRSADSNKDGATDALDRSNLDSSSESSNVYDIRDLNLDGAIDAVDRGIVQNVPEANQFL
jgi:hypothetical protein